MQLKKNIIEIVDDFPETLPINPKTKGSILAFDIPNIGFHRYSLTGQRNMKWFCDRLNC
jgi:hypothetical protein